VGTRVAFTYLAAMIDATQMEIDAITDSESVRMVAAGVLTGE
jgi:hypothetical protein